MKNAATALVTLQKEIINAGLCTRCGSCVGICPKQKLQFNDPLGECLPVADGTLDCADCSGPCLQACPGAEVNFVELNQQVFNLVPDDFLLGQAKEWYVGWATDQKIREKGASGGVITAMLKHLLEHGVVKGVVCLIDDPTEPLKPQPVIVTDVETLQMSQQSRYSIAPVNTVLRELEIFDGPVAYVALPDQVHSIRKLQELNHPSVRNIKVIIGSYCGAIQHFSAITAFLKKHGITDLTQVASIEYRAGAWPGKLRITMHSGAQYELEKFYANYMTLFYSMERSLLCIDLSNELADISCGDAWSPKYENRHEGFSLLAVRTDVGQTIANRCIQTNAIAVIPCSQSEAREMHSHGLYNKKYAVWSRIDLRKWTKRKNPYYGYKPYRTLKQKLVGLGIALIFEFGRTKLAHLIIQLLPLKFTGQIFFWIRKRWRKATRPKRNRAMNAYNVHRIS